MNNLSVYDKFFLSMLILHTEEHMKQMNRNFLRVVATSAAMAILLISCSSGNSDTSDEDETTIADVSGYTTAYVLSADNFSNISSGGSIAVTTISAGPVASPTASTTEQKLQFCANTISSGSYVPLSGGSYSDNATYSDSDDTATLSAAAQTTTYTISSSDATTLKSNGLIILGYGVAITKIVNSSASTSTYTTNVTVDTDDSSKTYFANNLSSGWNLGNYFDSWSSSESNSAFSTNWCGTDITSQTVFDNVKSAGFDFVRIPITWRGHLGSSPSYTINASFLSKVKTVVDYALAAGLTVVINIHHDGADTGSWLDISTADDSDAKFLAQTAELTAIWSQIAYTFRNYGSNLMFEGFNEIQDGYWGYGANTTDSGVQYAILNKWNQAFVTTVRATGSNNQYRYLALNGYSANPDLVVSNLTIPTDPSPDTVKRIIVSFHYYQPTDFAIDAKINKWGSKYGGVSSSSCSSWGQEDYLITEFNKVYNAFSDYAIYIGEYGATYQGTTYVDYSRYYDEFLACYAHTKGILPIAWDNNATTSGSECFGLIDRSTGSARSTYSTIVSAIENATNGTDTDYTALTDPSDK